MHGFKRTSIMYIKDNCELKTEKKSLYGKKTAFTESRNAYLCLEIRLNSVNNILHTNNNIINEQ